MVFCGAFMLRHGLDAESKRDASSTKLERRAALAPVRRAVVSASTDKSEPGEV